MPFPDLRPRDVCAGCPSAVKLRSVNPSPSSQSLQAMGWQRSKQPPRPQQPLGPRQPCQAGEFGQELVGCIAAEPSLFNQWFNVGPNHECKVAGGEWCNNDHGHKLQMHVVPIMFGCRAVLGWDPKCCETPLSNCRQGPPDPSVCKL
jgi:hypothetical protein